LGAQIAACTAIDPIFSGLIYQAFSGARPDLRQKPDLGETKLG